MEANNTAFISEMEIKIWLVLSIFLIVLKIPQKRINN